VFLATSISLGTLTHADSNPAAKIAVINLHCFIEFI
jgi:hypothetical protein